MFAEFVPDIRGENRLKEDERLLRLSNYTFACSTGHPHIYLRGPVPVRFAIYKPGSLLDGPAIVWH